MEQSGCVLCPRACGVDREAGQRGYCGAGTDMVVARSALHFWEEPPLCGTVGSGAIFFSFCSLGCVYCQNRVISQSEVGRVVSVDEVADMMLSLKEQGALNINLVTPTHYSDKVREAIRCARERGCDLPIVWNTSGYESVSNIKANCGFVDIYLTDYKYADAELARALSHASDYPPCALAALDEMVAQAGPATFDTFAGLPRMTRGVVVRYLLLPGHLDDAKAVVRLLHERYGDAVKLSLMSQYTPVLASDAAAGDARAAAELRYHPELARRVDAAEYEELLDFADDLGIEEYWWQEGDAALESFIPPFGMDEDTTR